MVNGTAGGFSGKVKLLEFSISRMQKRVRISWGLEVLDSDDKPSEKFPRRNMAIVSRIIACVKQ
jgi:hypothetical protein